MQLRASQGSVPQRLSDDAPTDFNMPFGNIHHLTAAWAARIACCSLGKE